MANNSVTKNNENASEIQRPRLNASENVEAARTRLGKGSFYRSEVTLFSAFSKWESLLIRGVNRRLVIWTLYGQRGFCKEGRNPELS